MSILFKSRQSGAQNTNVPVSQKIVMHLVSHLRQALAAIGDLIRTPVATAMTVAVLGLSITLPTTLYILVKNFDKVRADTQQAAEISVFIRQDVSVADIEQLQRRLSTWPEIDEVAYVSATQALEEFRQHSGFGDALGYLDNNPLPDVMLIYPAEKHSSPTAAKVLLDKLLQEHEIELGKLDIEWLKRLHAILAAANELVTMIALLLFVSVVLIVGNTIRLDIFNKRNEILVMKLVGATDSFIQRPFLYTGMWYGILGAVMAWITVALLLWWMDNSIAEILSLYRQEFDLQGLDMGAMFSMLFLSVAMGLLGSAISVKRYVAQIEPK
jgi:cell division transport system permease protein